MDLNNRHNGWNRHGCVSLLSGAGALALCLVALSLLPGGCFVWPWQNPDPEPASVARGGKNAFCEREFAADPNLTVGLGDIVVLDLRAAESEEGDTGNETGVDEIPYYFRDRMQISIRFALGNQRGHSAVLRDETGRELVAATNGADAPAVMIDPGRYTLHVRHAQKGLPEAPGDVLFLTLSGEARRVPLLKSQVAKHATDCPGGSIKPLPWNLTVSDSAAGLTFSCWEASYQEFSDKDFSNCSFVGCNFFGVRMTLCNFAGARFQQPDSDSLCQSPLRMGDATFDQCAMAGASFDLAAEQTDVPLGASFVSSDLTGTTFQGTWRWIDFTGSDLSGATLVHSPYVYWYGSFARADLSGADFSGLDLRHCTFKEIAAAQGVSFAGSTLSGNADFSGANLQGCDFSSANLTGANFEGADLANARLDHIDAIGVNWSNLKSLQGASLKGVKHVNAMCFTGLNMAGCDLTGAEPLKDCNFDSANMSKATITPRADLTGCSFRNVRMTGVDLRGAVCDGADFTGADMRECNLAGATLIVAVLNQADLQSANLSNAVALGAHLAYADLEGANLQGILLGTASPTDHPGPAILDHAFMPNVNLEGADLRNVRLAGAHLYGKNATLQNAKMDGVDLAGCVASGMDFTNAKASNANFDYAVLVNCKFVGASLAGAHFHLAYLQGTDFTQAFLAGADLTSASFDVDPNTLCLDVYGKPIANTWCYTGPDGQVYEVIVKAPKPPTSTPNMTCPDGAGGPCTPAERHKPIGPGPYPPKPECLPGENQWCPPPH